MHAIKAKWTVMVAPYAAVVALWATVGLATGIGTGSAVGAEPMTGDRVADIHGVRGSWQGRKPRRALGPLIRASRAARAATAITVRGSFQGSKKRHALGPWLRKCRAWRASAPGRACITARTDPHCPPGLVVVRGGAGTAGMCLLKVGAPGR